jgi:regulator of sigma E protease
MSVVWTILALVIVLGLVVFVHELGHYIAARISGVRVLAFSIGFRPIWRWTDKRGTEWRIGWIPFGGYCTMYGQDDMFDRKKYSKLPADKKVGHYLSVSAWKQAFILVSGVAMNFLLAFVIYFGINWAIPRDVQLPVVGQVVQQSVAYDAGVRAGDTVLKINGGKIENWGELIIAKEMAGTHDSNVEIARGDRVVSVTLAAADRWGLIADGAKTVTVRKSFPLAIIAGARDVWTNSKMMVVVVQQIITGERSSKQLGSFISIAQMSGRAMAAGFVSLLSIIALISVNLGIVNLFPLPVLDGGYLLILAVEGITRKKLQGRAMEYVIMTGWILLGLLFALTMKNDIFRVLGW